MKMDNWIFIVTVYRKTAPMFMVFKDNGSSL